MVARPWKTIARAWDWSYFLCGNCNEIHISTFGFLISVTEISSLIHIVKQVPVYIAEITPKNLRGGYTTIHQVMGIASLEFNLLIKTKGKNKKTENRKEKKLLNIWFGFCTF